MQPETDSRSARWMPFSARTTYWCISYVDRCGVKHHFLFNPESVLCRCCTSASYGERSVMFEAIQKKPSCLEWLVHPGAYKEAFLQGEWTTLPPAQAHVRMTQALDFVYC